LLTLEIEVQLRSLLDQYGGLLRTAIASHCPRDLGLQTDDLMQEACLRLWKALAKEREIHNVPCYLQRIAATVTIDAVRRVKARREEQLPFSQRCDSASGEKSERPQPLDLQPSPELRAEHKWLIALTKQIIGGFAPNRRLAVELYLEGLSNEEIARRLGWSESKARNLVYRGLYDLRARLPVRQRPFTCACTLRRPPR
jgi:RNA polymerase sigma-70 factor (ECF subfamily)